MIYFQNLVVSVPVRCYSSLQTMNTNFVLNGGGNENEIGVQMFMIKNDPNLVKDETNVDSFASTENCEFGPNSDIGMDEGSAGGGLVLSNKQEGDFMTLQSAVPQSFGMEDMIYDANGGGMGGYSSVGKKHTKKSLNTEPNQSKIDLLYLAISHVEKLVDLSRTDPIN